MDLLDIKKTNIAKEKILLHHSHLLAVSKGWGKMNLS